jgi:cytidylate kinase
MTAVIAIDGPSGSGKSTVSRAVAEELGMEVLDTGAMYRAVTLAALRAGVDPSDGEAVAGLARAARLEIGERVLLDGRDVSDAIRGPDVTAVVSIASAHPAVRRELVARQRAWVAERGRGVVEGRDIGTVVFPDAPVKVFLVARDDVRARRRQLDEQAAARRADLDDVRAAMARRDALDAGRVASPLRPADDAVELDTTDRGVEELAAEIVGRFRVATGSA